MIDMDERRCGRRDRRGAIVSNVLEKSPHRQFVNNPHLKVMKGKATVCCILMGLVVVFSVSTVLLSDCEEVVHCSVPQ